MADPESVQEKTRQSRLEARARSRLLREQSDLLIASAQTMLKVSRRTAREMSAVQTARMKAHRKVQKRQGGESMR